MSLCNTRCIFLTSSSHFRPLPPRIFTAVDDDGEDLEVSNDDNVDVDDVCDDGDCEGFGNDACVDKSDCDGECDAFELEFVDDNCADNVRPCLAEQSDCVTVDTCTVYGGIDDDSFDDNDLVDISSVNVSVDDVDVVCEDESFDDDDDCHNT